MTFDDLHLQDFCKLSASPLWARCHDGKDDWSMPQKCQWKSTAPWFRHIGKWKCFFFLCCKNRSEKMGQRTTAHLPKKSRNRKKKQQKQGKAKETQNLASFLSGPEALGPYHSWRCERQPNDHVWLACGADPGANTRHDVICQLGTLWTLKGTTALFA